MAKEPHVAVVMTVRNSVRVLDRTLASLAALDWPRRRLSIVIVDAFSDDGTWEALQDFAESCPFRVVLDQKAGPIGTGRNHAFTLTDAPFVAVTDADMVVPPRWIHELLAGMEDGIGVVGGPNDGAGTDLISRATDAIPVHGPTQREVTLRGRSRYLKDFTTSDDVFAAVTRNCLFRREAFDAAGGFDEALVTTEDGELNRRILDAGYRIRYRLAAGVLHHHRPTLRGFWRQQRNYARGQAQANRKDRRMRKTIHFLPAIALAGFIALAVVTAIWWPLWPALAGAAAVALFASLAYGVKAAVVRKDAALALAVPVLFATWMMAWAVGYPRGRLATGGRHADS